jgi:hypothetical protein
VRRCQPSGCRRRQPAHPLTRGRPHDVQQSGTHTTHELYGPPRARLAHHKGARFPTERGTWWPQRDSTVWAVSWRWRQRQLCVSRLFPIVREASISYLSRSTPGPGELLYLNLSQSWCTRARLPRTTTNGKPCTRILDGVRRTSSHS